jgi:beta-glucanase (GH16 family)
MWADEFDYVGTPNPDLWEFEVGFVRNGENQYYTDNRSKNGRVENGSLILEAHTEEYWTFDKRLNCKILAKYTSASVTSRLNYPIHYGRVEIRAQIPGGNGLWPALWMLGTGYKKDTPWPICGEIDIMEQVGFSPEKVYADIDCTKYNHYNNNGKGNSVTVEGATERFVVYALEWYKDRLEFYADDVKYFTFEKDPDGGNDAWPFDKPFFLLMNLAVGGAWGGLKGIDDTIFPQKLAIDYVRVYQHRDYLSNAYEFLNVANEVLILLFLPLLFIATRMRLWSKRAPSSTPRRIETEATPTLASTYSERLPVSMTLTENMLNNRSQKGAPSQSGGPYSSTST